MARGTTRTHSRAKPTFPAAIDPPRPARRPRATPPLRLPAQQTDPESGLVYYGLRYYIPPIGRWASRDPIGENGGACLAAFVINNPVSIVDTDGRVAVALGFASGPAAKDAPPIDCSGYGKLGGVKCKGCCGVGDLVDDAYPESAKSICEGFKDLYTGTPWQKEAACVASCLISAEKKCQGLSNCSDRNCCRLLAHIECYDACDFIPKKWLPPGGLKVGAFDLLPSAVLCPTACQYMALKLLPFPL